MKSTKKVFISALFLHSLCLFSQQDSINTSKDIEEVLITGRRNNSYLVNTTELGGKFSGILKDLPQSVSLVSKEFMEDKMAFQITDMIHDLAGVNATSPYDDMTIRGFRSGYESGLRLVNGMRSGYGYGTSYWRAPLTINLESIEVIKGSGSSLFGDIVPGGTINLVTKKPLSTQKSNVQLSYGSFNTFRATLDTGGPLNKDKKILYRLNAGYETTETFRDNNSRKTMMIAPSFTFKPFEGTQIDVDFTYDKSKGYLDRGLAIKNNIFYAQPRNFNINLPTDFYNAQFLSSTIKWSQKILPNLDFHTSYMRAEYTEELDELRTRNAYADAPKNELLRVRFQSKNAKDYTDSWVSYFSLKLGQNSKIKHRIILGTDWAKYRPDENNILREARQRRDENGNIVDLIVDLTSNNRPVFDKNSYVWRRTATFPFLNPYSTIGIYLQDHITIGDRLNIVLGLRNEQYRSYSSDLKDTYTTKENKWLPRVGVSYKVNNNINYFASYTKGYVPAGADLIYKYDEFGATQPYKTENSYQVETGVKMGFFKNQLQAEVSLFHIDREHMRISTGRYTDAGREEFKQSNKVISQGVELDFRGQITKELQLSGNYTYNHTEIKSSQDGLQEKLPLGNAPRHLAGLWAKYVFSNQFLKGFGFGAGVYYVDKRRMDNSMRNDANGTPVFDNWPSYTIANASVYYHFKGVRIAANVNNIFDKYYYLGGYDYTRAFVGAPRNYMVSVGYSF